MQKENQLESALPKGPGSPGPVPVLAGSPQKENPLNYGAVVGNPMMPPRLDVGIHA